MLSGINAAAIMSSIKAILQITLAVLCTSLVLGASPNNNFNQDQISGGSSFGQDRVGLGSTVKSEDEFSRPENEQFEVGNQDQGSSGFELTGEEPNSFGFDQNEGIEAGAFSSAGEQKHQQPAEKQKETGSGFELSKILSGKLDADIMKLPNGDKINPIDHFFLDIVPKIWRATPSNENGTASQFKELAYNDDTNDDATHLSGVSSVESILSLFLKCSLKANQQITPLLPIARTHS